MRICYINYEKYGGGSWVHTSRFIAALKEIHNDLVVHTPQASQGATEEAESTPIGKSFGFTDNLKEVRLLAAMFGRRIIEEFHLLKTTKPDVVILRQARYLSAIPLCRLLNIPIILEINGPSLENEFTPKKDRVRGTAFWHWLDKKMMNLAAYNIVVSETLKHYYVTDGISSEKITSVPNGVDIHTFNADIKGDRVRERLGLKGKTIVGFSGRFAPWHGLDFLIDAMRIINDSSQYNELAFLLVGAPGHMLATPDLPDEISTITGHIPHEEMPEYLAAIDIFVAPYPLISPFYFSPLKIFESMSMGKPVIASAQGQISELITDQVSGLLYPPGDQSALIACIERLLNDTQLRHDLGRNASKTMENNFTWNDNARRILNICRKVVEREK
ncbi:MAG: glycosyltransferase family 1 protein [Candidatus Electrothrix sp. AR4]|nr:glycosyltransferase family 1 protein [Candidatus Electrothrix sp. AR4]